MPDPHLLGLAFHMTAASCTMQAQPDLVNAYGACYEHRKHAEQPWWSTLTRDRLVAVLSATMWFSTCHLQLASRVKLTNPPNL